MGVESSKEISEFCSQIYLRNRLNYFIFPSLNFSLYYKSADDNDLGLLYFSAHLELSTAVI